MCKSVIAVMLQWNCWHRCFVPIQQRSSLPWLSKFQSLAHFPQACKAFMILDHKPTLGICLFRVEHISSLLGNASSTNPNNPVPNLIKFFRNLALRARVDDWYSRVLMWWKDLFLNIFFNSRPFLYLFPLGLRFCRLQHSQCGDTHI